MSKFKRWDRELFFENFLIFLLYIITLYPLTRVGFVVADDIDLYSHCFAGHWHLLVDDVILSHGRFYLVFMRYLYGLPYLVDSRLWFLFFYITPIALCFIAAVRLIKRLFHSSALSLFCALFFACCFQIIGWHSVTTSYPFYFTTAFLLLLCSLHLFLSYYESQKKKYLYFSALVMFLCSLFYESFLMYYLLFVIIALWKNKAFAIKTKAVFLKVLLDLIPFLCGGVIYLIAYFTFQKFYPPAYDGIAWGKDLSLWGFLQTAFQMQREAFPLQVYSIHISFLRGMSTFTDGSFALLRYDLIFYISGFIAMVLLWIAFEKYKEKIQYKYLLSLFLCGVLLLYLPLVFVCLSKRYYLNWVNSYVPTFYTFFGFACIFTSIVFATLNVVSKNKILLTIFKCVMCAIIFFVCSTTQMMNKAVSKDMRLSSIRFEMATQALREKIIPGLTPSTPICLEQLHYTSSASCINITKQYLTWSEFFAKQTGIQYNLYEDYQSFHFLNRDNSSVVWTSFFKQSHKDEDALLYFVPSQGTRLPERQDSIVCDSLIGYYHSPYKTFSITILTSEAQKEVFINDMQMISNGNCHTLNIGFPLKHGKANSLFTIRGKGLIAYSLCVSNILTESRDNPNATDSQSEYERQIKENINTICKDSTWLSSVKQKAKKKHISVSKALEYDAIWIYNNSKKK